MSATFTVNKAALDALSAQRWTRHLLIDAEQDRDGWAIVVRGDDRAKTGAEGKNKPTFAWNDETGAARRFVVASYSGDGAQAQAVKAVEALRAFYAGEAKPFSERITPVADCGETAVTIALMLAAVLQAGANPHTNSSSHWIVGSVNDTSAAKRAAREKKDKAAAVATITAAAKDPKALEQIAASVQTPEELAALAAIVATCKANMAAA